MLQAVPIGQRQYALLFAMSKIYIWRLSHPDYNRSHTGRKSHQHGSAVGPFCTIITELPPAMFERILVKAAGVEENIYCCSMFDIHGRSFLFSASSESETTA